MEGKHFEKWFETVTPKLKLQGIIVMDIASCHSVKKEKIPPSSWKSAVQEWLSEKEVIYMESRLELQLNFCRKLHTQFSCPRLRPFFQTSRPKLDFGSVFIPTAHLEKCTTCVDCEDLCDILEEILDTLNDPDTPSTPERLRLVNLIQWTVLKRSRKSIRLQNQEFKDYIREIERLNRIPIASALETEESQTSVCIASERHSVEETGTLGVAAPTQHHTHKALSSMEEGETSAEESYVALGVGKSLENRDFWIGEKGICVDRKNLRSLNPKNPRSLNIAGRIRGVMLK
ncbi:hypothetical protein TNIN_448171 [Trichonephila inaurata madagascariensis]|uniref:Uncharacterized protein n=1 Tax=Trichonephila inaurata madagascariensis TaxID=2747483 RepID=A0A8X6WS46_9ARAC|nr:hypothetical protein TNIN_448171 [Trichonephila inaurata madagascariensis]